MISSDKVYIAGHNGMVGSAILRNLNEKSYHNFLLKSSREVDLRNQQAVNELFASEKPEYVFLAAAKVGGINANNLYSAEFLYDNLMIQSNVINAAWKFGATKLLFLGSSCIYPKIAPQPLKESYLLTGLLEPTNEAYAIAKIAGIKMCDSYRKQYGCNFMSAMPTNLYGPNDNYDLQNSHVLPALIRKFHEAKITNADSVTVWGTGKALREFLHVDDMAAACVHLMETYNETGFVNVGTGKDISISTLATLISNIIGFQGEIIFDSSMPDGTMRKLLDVSKMNELEWTYSISLEEGIRRVYEDFKAKSLT